VSLAIPSPVRWPVLAERLPRSAATTALVVLGGAALTALCAQISIPIPWSPVPLTGQTFAIILTGAALGPARGVAAQLLYVAAGLLGAPVFAGHSGGIHVLYGATGGYLVGFIAAALLMGWGSRFGRDRRVVSQGVLVIAASLVIYVFGAGWLAVRLGGDVAQALALGVVPFLVGDAVKALLAAGVLPGAWRLVNRLDAKGHDAS
jgi:biotin transport system substrate-specific component